MRRLVLLGALLLLFAIPAHAQVLRVQDYTFGDPPEARSRVCISTDGACDRLGFQIENDEQLVVVADTPGQNVQIDAVNMSEAPGDDRALACHNALATGAVMQACAYGLNYPGTLSGIRLAGRAKFVGYNGAVFGTYSGPLDMIVDGTHVATFRAGGFGFGGYNARARNAATLGWGQCTAAPDYGEVSMCAMPGPGGIYHLYVVTSDGGQRCLTCAP